MLPATHACGGWLHCTAMHACGQLARATGAQALAPSLPCGGTTRQGWFWFQQGRHDVASRCWRTHAVAALSIARRPPDGGRLVSPLAGRHAGAHRRPLPRRPALLVRAAHCSRAALDAHQRAHLAQQLVGSGHPVGLQLGKHLQPLARMRVAPTWCASRPRPTDSRPRPTDSMRRARARRCACVCGGGGGGGGCCTRHPPCCRQSRPQTLRC